MPLDDVASPPAELLAVLVEGSPHGVAFGSGHGARFVIRLPAASRELQGV